MTTIKRDVFRRATRMVHRFDELAGAGDPFGSGTFEMEVPVRPDHRHSKSAEVQQHGEHMYRESSSPVCKPGGGYASINGPAPDLPQIFGMPVPVGTKRRLGPAKSDK